MINYVYKQLQAKKLKSFFKSKINVWSIINPKHNFINTTKIFYIYNKLNVISYSTFGTLNTFFNNKLRILEVLITSVLLTTILVCIFG